MLSSLPRPLEESLRNSPVVSPVLDGWSDLDLPDCWLVAGAVAQSYWNTAHGFSPLHGVSDVDLVYFDPDDLTEESERRQSSRIRNQFDFPDIEFDVKNEARVHLWYEARFGYPISAYSSVESAIDTFPTTAGAIGVRPAGLELGAYAPFGFDDLLNLVVRPNKCQVTRAIYMDKVRRWAALWPRLRIIEWDDS